MHLTSVLDVTNIYAASRTLKLLGYKPQHVDAIAAAIQTNGTFNLIRSSAAYLCRNAFKNIDSYIHLSDHMSWLINNDYSREDIRQIRYIAEVFHYIEPVFILMAAFFEYVMQRHESNESVSRLPECEEIKILLTGPVDYVCEDNIPYCINAICDRYGTPLHMFYRALAIWPDFLKHIWDELEVDLNTVAYAIEANDINRQAFVLASKIPISYCFQVKNEIDCMSTIDDIMHLSTEIAVVSSAMRRVFIKTEVALRNIRI